MIQVRNVPGDLHCKLESRAAPAGKYNHELYNPRTGHEIGTDDGTTYYDLQTGEQVSFPASAN